MDPFKNQQLLSTLGTWLQDNWFELVVIFAAALIAYFAGTRIVAFIVKRAVKGARHRAWHKKDIEKRQKTLVGLFVSVWRIVIFFTVLYALLAVFFPNIGTAMAPLFASAGIIGVALGFGAQSLIKDFLSGIYSLFLKTSTALVTSLTSKGFRAQSSGLAPEARYCAM